jgi:hypothetical protein
VSKKSGGVNDAMPFALFSLLGVFVVMVMVLLVYLLVRRWL